MKAKRGFPPLFSYFLVCLFGPGPWGRDAPAMAYGDVTISAAVNAPPDFTPGGDMTVLEDAGPQTRTHDGLVGHLSFTPAQDANGSTTVRVWAVDDGGTANGGSDTSEEKTLRPGKAPG